MRRKSDDQHRLNRTFRADRHGADPAVLEASLIPPGSLSPAALAHWRRREPELRRAGLLQEYDAELFGLWCALAAHLDECYAAGKIPARDAMVNFRALSREIGVGSDSRSRMGVGKSPVPKKQPSAFDDVD